MPSISNSPVAAYKGYRIKAVKGGYQVVGYAKIWKKLTDITDKM